MGKGERPGVNSIGPGPGAYDASDSVVKSSSKKATIGTSQRTKFVDTIEEKPGPGMYDASSTLNKQSYSIGKGERPGINSIAPGPGAYDAEDKVIRSSSKKATIGTG